MSKILPVVFILFLLLGGTIAALYIFYEKPKEEKEPEYYNVSIRTYEDISGKQVASGYAIVLDESTALYKNGTSREQGYVLEKVPKNHTFQIFNYNVGNQSYYTLRGRFYDYSGTKDEFRVDFPLTKQGNLTISHDGEFGTDSELHVTIDADGEFRYPSVCLQWSARVVSVTIPSYQETNKIPKRLQGKVVKCYEITQTIKDDHIIFPIRYSKFGNLDDADFIKIYILDGDIRYYSINPLDGYKSYIIEDEQGNDVGEPDIEYIVK